MNKEFFEAVKMMEAEKGISADYLYEKIKMAILSATRGQYGENVMCDIDPEAQTMNVYVHAEVVEENVRFKNNPEEIVNELKNRFRAHVRVAPAVVISSVEEVQRINFPPSARKPVKFIDLR